MSNCCKSAQWLLSDHMTAYNDQVLKQMRVNYLKTDKSTSSICDAFFQEPVEIRYAMPLDGLKTPCDRMQHLQTTCCKPT